MAWKLKTFFWNTKMLCWHFTVFSECSLFFWVVSFKVSYNIIFFPLKGMYLISLIYCFLKIFKFFKKNKTLHQEEQLYCRTRTHVWGQGWRGEVWGMGVAGEQRAEEELSLAFRAQIKTCNTNPETKRNRIIVCFTLFTS